ncbi:MAG TPA: hypothetical protein VMV22_11410 [Acidimicrobiales bacterium]|nr:hypothetical protein [Acidimicrobiales bacterium]
MTAKPRNTSRRRQRARQEQYRRRFGLPATAVLPLFGPMPPARGSVPFTPQRPALDPMPVALVVFEPGLSRPRRLLARLGTSRLVTVLPGNRPVSLKALVFVGLGAVTGTIAAQPFDPVTYLAPLYGLLVGGVGAGAGWRALRGRWATTIGVDEWRGELDAILGTLQSVDRIGQPFVSPPALRTALHSALWHAADAVGHPGDRDVLDTFTEQLAALRIATGSALAELESPTIEARKAVVSDQLAAAVDQLSLIPPTARQVQAGEGLT